MRHTAFVVVLLLAAILADTLVHAEATAESSDRVTEYPTIRTGVVGFQLRERGALLIEDFKGDEVDEKKWRIWHSDPQTAVLAS